MGRSQNNVPNGTIGEGLRQLSRCKFEVQKSKFYRTFRDFLQLLIRTIAEAMLGSYICFYRQKRTQFNKNLGEYCVELF